MEKQTASIPHALIASVVKLLQERYDIAPASYCGGWRITPTDLEDRFKMEIRRSGPNAHLRIWAGGNVTGQLANSRYDDFYAECVTPEDWRAPEDVTRNRFPDSKTFGSVDYLVRLATEVIEWVNANVEYSAPAVKCGVSFNETNFAGYGERDFMAATIQIQKLGFANVMPSVGSNLGFEYVLPSTGSRVDAVEFNETGEVVTVIECQSGIQNGAYLDDEHFAKAISRYPQSAEVVNTVRKIVTIAGGYAPEQLATFKQLPYEIVALQTKVEDGKIVLEAVAY